MNCPSSSMEMLSIQNARGPMYICPLELLMQVGWILHFLVTPFVVLVMDQKGRNVCLHLCKLWLKAGKVRTWSLIENLQKKLFLPKKVRRSGSLLSSIFWWYSWADPEIWVEVEIRLRWKYFILQVHEERETPRLQKKWFFRPNQKDGDSVLVRSTPELVVAFAHYTRHLSGEGKSLRLSLQSEVG